MWSDVHLCGHLFSPKTPDPSEREIRLNEERFEKLLKTLSSISKNLRVQLQRKTLLLGTTTPLSRSPLTAAGECRDSL